MAEKAVAILTIRNSDRMTKRGRKMIADWLQHQADQLVEIGPEYAPLFTARYLVDPGKASHVRDFKVEPAEPVVA
jgi:hypothetical protein